MRARTESGGQVRLPSANLESENSIDLPIVSVASALIFDGAVIKDAGTVLGAVAPIPLRAVNVEEFLIGRKANEETAELAGAIACKQAFPLARNG